MYRSHDPNDALNIFNDRIANSFKMNALFNPPIMVALDLLLNAFKMKSKFTIRNYDIAIVASKESGTMIKFVYPYGTVKNKNIDR